jgi:hypothetical protein
MQSAEVGRGLVAMGGWGEFAGMSAVLAQYNAVVVVEEGGVVVLDRRFFLGACMRVLRL